MYVVAQPGDRIKMGFAEVVEEVMIGEDKLIRFSGVAGKKACTVSLSPSFSSTDSFGVTCQQSCKNGGGEEF